MSGTVVIKHRTVSAMENNVEYENNVEINGKVDRSIYHGLPKKVHYIAPAPADHITSFSGSGLPFVNESQAFDNTPNQGVADINLDGSFTFRIRSPNSYYKNFHQLVKPHVLLQFDDNNEPIHIDLAHESIPFRSMYREKHTHERKNKIQNQEAMLRDKGFPFSF